MAWYETLSEWLVGIGYERSKNDPCLFTNRQGHQLVVHVDDILCRGTMADSVDFYNRLGARFDCKDPEFLIDSGILCYTGLDIERTVKGEEDWYYVSQVSELQELLDDAELLGVEERESPMPDRRKMLQDRGVISVDQQRWCRTLIGGLNFLARCTRWDIAHAVSRVSSEMKEPTAGTVRALEHIAGYLVHTPGMRLAGKRSSARDQYVTYADSDHHGDPGVSTHSHTGVTVLLNGTPVFWRSNKQKFAVALSPAEAEIYALSEGARDAQDVAWVLEEMGCELEWPLVVKTDSDQALSFQWDSVARSKLRGCIDKREKWVEELRDRDRVVAVSVDTKYNMADIHTKCLATSEFKRQRDRIMNSQLSRGMSILGEHL
jgi:hypothetical protein